MQFILFQLISVYAILTHEVIAKESNPKPKFIPYCRTTDRCEAACSCRETPNCALLDLDESMRKSIVSYHNQFREIQTRGEPIPGGLSKLEYDEDLEQVSRCWAARCEVENSDCFLTQKFNETSQAIAQRELQRGAEPKVTMLIEMIDSWIGQVKTLSAEMLSSLPAKGGIRLHNFAQVMSDRILHVGCAWSKKNQVVIFVCTYGPRGPIVGEAVFKIGRVCSMCPSNYECDNLKPFNRLCKEMPPITIPTPPLPPPIPQTTPVSPPPELPQFPSQSTTVVVMPPPIMPPIQHPPVIVPKFPRISSPMQFPRVPPLNIHQYPLQNAPVVPPVRSGPPLRMLPIADIRQTETPSKFTSNFFCVPPDCQGYPPPVPPRRDPPRPPVRYHSGGDVRENQRFGNSFGSLFPPANIQRQIHLPLGPPN